ncbi:glycoside hydrolase family 76 protein [Hypoxylon sp. FL1284]|nr:glycoside hydrolase family 76 protein [Hypoxylon sp. FL1284]
MALSLLCVLTLACAAHGLSGQSVGKPSLTQECPIFLSTAKRCDPVAPKSFLPADAAAAWERKEPHSPDLSVLVDVLDAMHDMQTAYFAPWLGTWPDAIDWTAAVMGTHISGATRSLSEALIHIDPDRTSSVDWKLKSNLVERYFTQVTAYYFGQDAFAIRNEAYDDILWVVLGWLETIQLINVHTNLHFSYGLQHEDGRPQVDAVRGIADFFSNQTYHGNTWIPAFSHRARIFWDLASTGWDTELCGGGMIWNPRLLPYKNAITNELFIAASISMYLYFPGDENVSPYVQDSTDNSNPRTHSGPGDAEYLKAAVEGYKWLVSSNMTNQHGLYIDGFHISGYTDARNNNTKCDLRDDVVLSYNQGVLLTGLRGLWDATGASSYLSDGHRLIQNVIKASGYDLVSDAAIDDISTLKPGRLPRWHGLGRAGVMEDPCDASGTCSQDGQTFKGIFFHHLTAFCASLAAPAPEPGTGTAPNFDAHAFAAAAASHAHACSAYGGWLKHNARAALATRDDGGRFGQWWTAGLLQQRGWAGPWPTTAEDGVPRAPDAVDYHNYGVPDEEPWRRPVPRSPQREGTLGAQQQQPMAARARADELRRKKRWVAGDGVDADARDPNTRGRGRTVETQGGGLALLRAHWKIAHAP